MVLTDDHRSSSDCPSDIFAWRFEVVMPDPKNKLGLAPTPATPVVQEPAPTPGPDPETIPLVPEQASTPDPNTTPTTVISPKPTVDPAYGHAPVPPEDQHFIIGDGRPAKVPDHILFAEDDDIIQHLIEDGDAIVSELTGSAMHDRLQNVVAHFRHVLVEARSRFLLAVADVPSQGGFTTPILAFLALMVASIFWVPNAQAQRISDFQPGNNATAAAVGPAGVLVNSSGNLITVSPGPVYCNGAISYIHNTVFNLTGPPAIPAVASADGQSATFFVWYSCAQDQVAVSVFPPPTATGVMLGTVKQSNSAGSLSYTITDTRSTFQFPNMSDAIIPFGPGDCAWNATGTLGATTGLNLQAIGASFAPVNSISTTNAGATVDNLTCNIHVPQRTTASKGIQLLDCVIYYGVQTTALTSLGAPTLNTITMPAPGTSETASTVTPVSLGAVTVTPVVGSANLGTTTAGAFFTEKVALNTPVFLNTDIQMIQYNQTFNQSASAAQIVNTPGGVCHALVVPL